MNSSNPRKLLRTTLTLGALLAAAFTLSACHGHLYGHGYYGHGHKGGHGHYRGGHKRDGHYRRGGRHHRRGY